MEKFKVGTGKSSIEKHILGLGWWERSWGSLCPNSLRYSHKHSAHATLYCAIQPSIPIHANRSFLNTLPMLCTGILCMYHPCIYVYLGYSWARWLPARLLLLTRHVIQTVTHTHRVTSISILNSIWDEPEQAPHWQVEQEQFCMLCMHVSYHIISSQLVYRSSTFSAQVLQCG